MAVWTAPGTVNANKLLVSGVDQITYCPLDVAPITWSDIAGETWGDLSFTVMDTTATRSLQGGAAVEFFVDGTLVFGGTLLRKRFKRIVGAGRVIECECVSADSWLDWRIVPQWASKANTDVRKRLRDNDRQMVQDLIERRGGPLLAPNATVASTNTNMDPVRAQQMTVREVLELIAAEAQTTASPGKRRFYVDERYRVHWYTGLEGNAAPYRIADGSYVRDVLDTSGLVEYWTLREESGTTNHGARAVADLTLAGSYTQAQTSVGVVNETGIPATTGSAGYRSVLFTATGRTSKTSAPASLFPGDTFTLELWFRRVTTGTLQYLIFTSGGSDDAYEAFFNTDDKLYFRLHPGGDNNFVSTATVTDGNWHHLVVAHNPGDTTVYYDGSSWAGTHTNRVFGSSATTFQVSHPTSGFAGYLQHVAVYNAKLSAATALAHYRQGISISPEDVELEDDWTDVFHHAYVVGSTGKKDDAGSGWVYNTGSDFERGAVQEFIEREHSDTRAERDRAGKAAIRQASRVRGLNLRTQVAAAWRSGQTLTVTEDAYGLSGDTFEIRAVNGELTERGAIFDIEAGALRHRLTRHVRRRRRKRR